MKISYFSNKSWNAITREERLFCAELYFELKNENNIKPFLDLCRDVSKEEMKCPYDVGYEVCFYRDMLELHNINKEQFFNNIYRLIIEDKTTLELIKKDLTNKGKIKEDENEEITKEEIINKINGALRKRTFDIALFSEKEIHIFEAKCHEKFKRKQVNDLKNDEKYINELFKLICNDIDIPKISLWAIVSNAYNISRTPILKEFKGKVLTWIDIFNIYKEKDFERAKVFERADAIYEEGN